MTKRSASSSLIPRPAGVCRPAVGTSQEPAGVAMVSPRRVRRRSRMSACRVGCAPAPRPHASHVERPTSSCSGPCWSQGATRLVAGCDATLAAMAVA
jgi:hypothetical protein